MLIILVFGRRALVAEIRLPPFCILPDKSKSAFFVFFSVKDEVDESAADPSVYSRNVNMFNYIAGGPAYFDLHPQTGLTI